MKISEMKKLLKKNGCYFVKELKGHEDWYSPITNKHFTIPRHPSQELKTGIAEAIKKQAGLK
ncbi:MAG: type II toxin-antitoxin system HicA family toxin [Saccharofermentans sp.]|nr:type II toxin-antitoxin system HicA family toxin [Saccharofermentans sp.]